MEIEEHFKRFNEIIKRYGLSEEDKAEELATFLTKHHGRNISSKEFATLFAIEDEDALIFLSYIDKGLRFKKTHIDKE